MGFEKGNKVSGGRPPGAPNKRTQALEEKCLELGCNPFEVLLMFAKGDWEGLGYDSSVYVKESSEGATTIGYTISPELRMQAAKEVCQYIMPKKKSVEHVTKNILEGMTSEQKLEAMKQAVKMLEGEVKNDPEPRTTG